LILQEQKGRTMPRVPVKLHLALDSDADALLSRDPFALLAGMMLDQQIAMERAFAGPCMLAERMGTPDRLDPAAIAAADPEKFAALMAGPPAVHRFPASMGARLQSLSRIIAEEYGGDAESLWSTAGSGSELLARLKALPGFGEQKARIFLALLGKQLGVRPSGWREAAGAYGEDGSRRSVADVVDQTSLNEVRTYKQEMKRAKQSAAS
jgi:uncharacterized HhH-GPD family protein